MTIHHEGVRYALYHPALGRVSYSAVEVSYDPELQVEQVIGLMRRYVIEDTWTGPMVEQARVAARLSPDPVQGVFEHVKRSVSFINDACTAEPLSFLPGDIAEVLIRPVDMATLPRPQGDCDDFVMYAAALLRANQIPCSFVTVKADARDPGRWSHVYLAAYPPGRGRIPLDISHGGYPGWEVENVYQRKEWPVDATALSPLLAAAAACGGLWLVWEVMK